MHSPASAYPAAAPSRIRAGSRGCENIGQWPPAGHEPLAVWRNVRVDEDHPSQPVADPLAAPVTAPRLTWLRRALVLALIVALYCAAMLLSG